MKTTTIERNSKETKIKLTLELLDPDQTGSFTGSCGVGFFDHMLKLRDICQPRRRQCC